jgi:L-fuculokinase
MNVVAIFDIGKTNKKVFLFNEHYQIVWEKSINLEETVDEDGFACEDINTLKSWILDSLSEVKKAIGIQIKSYKFQYVRR